VKAVKYIFFLRRAARTSKILKVKNDVVRDKVGVTQTVTEVMGGGGHVKMIWTCVPNGDNRWRFPTDDTQDIVRFLVIWAPKEVIIRISKDRGQGLVWRPAHLHKVL